MNHGHFRKCCTYTAANDVRKTDFYPYFILLTNNEGSRRELAIITSIMIAPITIWD